VFRHGERGQRGDHARAGEFAHLAKDHRGFFEYAGFLHLKPKVVALAGAFTDARENRDAAVLGGHVVDELHDDNGFADARAAKETGLASLDKRRHQVDHLDTRLKNRIARFNIREVRRIGSYRDAFVIA